MATGCRSEVAFVVVTCNSANHIRKCIESIVTHAVPAACLKTIVVIDNASTDGTAAILAELAGTVPGLRVRLCERNIGFGAANNIAFAEVAARYFVLLNPDTWLVADSISPALTLMAAQPAVAVCGLPLVFPDGSPQTHAYRFSSWHKWLLQLLGIRALVARCARVRSLSALLSRCRYGREFTRIHARPLLDLKRVRLGEHDGTSCPTDWVCGAAMIVDGNFIRETGGFDQQLFLYGEDEDLCIQAHRCGQSVVTVNAVPVVHIMGWSANRGDRGDRGDRDTRLTADCKFQSLRYFIHKNIPGPGSRLIMRLLLPFHVYGYRAFDRIWRTRKT